MRMESSRNIRKFVPGGLNREKEKAARKDTATAIRTAATDSTALLNNSRGKAALEKSRA